MVPGKSKDDRMARSKKTRTRKHKGQALVESALMSIVLALLLAGAVDFGRAFYTLIVVDNMAGEGASFASYFPDQDAVDSSCSLQTPNANKTIRQRARMVANDRGLIISQPTQDNIDIDTTDANGTDYGSQCSARCYGRKIKVTVTYTITDLFLPRLIGFSSIPITRSASQYILANVQKNGNCN